MKVKIIYTCDRCGKEFNAAHGTFRIYRPKKYFMKAFRPWYFYQDGFDLCEDCKESFEDWFENPNDDAHHDESNLSDEAKKILDDMLDRLGSDDENAS